MPIYEYQCPACGHQFDHWQKVSDKQPTVCPECGKDGLQKLVSAPSFQLKGTGWYVTDFRDKGKRKPAAEKIDGAAKPKSKPKPDKKDA